MSGMETLFVEHNKLSKKGSLSKAVDDVQKTLDLLKSARGTIATGQYAHYPSGHPLYFSDLLIRTMIFVKIHIKRLLPLWSFRKM